jgi:hypothetical protein
VGVQDGIADVLTSYNKDLLLACVKKMLEAEFKTDHVLEWSPEKDPDGCLLRMSDNILDAFENIVQEWETNLPLFSQILSVCTRTEYSEPDEDATADAAHHEVKDSEDDEAEDDAERDLLVDTDTRDDKPRRRLRKAFLGGLLRFANNPKQSFIASWASQLHLSGRLRYAERSIFHHVGGAISRRRSDQQRTFLRPDSAKKFRAENRKHKAMLIRKLVDSAQGSSETSASAMLVDLRAVLDAEDPDPQLEADQLKAARALANLVATGGKEADSIAAFMDATTF